MLLAGKGTDYRRWGSMARRVDVRLDALGEVSDPSGLMAAADVLALPSRFDIFGMTVLEGMAWGLPIITSDAAGASEIVSHRKDGWVVLAGSVPPLSEAIGALLDPGERSAVGKRARETAKEYSIEVHVHRVMEVYREVAASAASPDGSARLREAVP